jgi:hypothetical protein
MDLPRPAIVAVVRRELAALRREKGIPDFAGVLARIRSSLHALRSSRIQPVINGTGIIVHTNLGRSPLGPAVVETLHAIAANYNNLEYDLSSGERGSRAGYLEHNLALLCGAQAATVVNNCAAALVLLVATHVPPGARFLSSVAARPLVVCGQQSLEIFCLGILLSALGHFILSEYNSGIPMQLAVNAVGIAVMCLTAKMIDWYKAMDRMPVLRPAVPQGRGDRGRR